MALFVKLMLRLLSLMPDDMPYRLARRVAGLWMLFSPVKRHTTERNLERCYPGISEERKAELVRESFIHYVCLVFESGHSWYQPVDKLRDRCEEFVGAEVFRKALDSGRGVVVLAPHFGAWEFLGLFIQQFASIAVLYKPPANPGLETALIARRERAGALLIPATSAGIRKLYGHIRGGGAAGILPDQMPKRGLGRFAPFFGHQALTGVLVPKLVQRIDCLVVASVAERLPGGRYRVHVLEVDEEIHSQDIDVSLAALNRAVEACIAINPAQYLWSYRRFKKQPEGEPPFYDIR